MDDTIRLSYTPSGPCPMCVWELDRRPGSTREANPAYPPLGLCGGHTEQVHRLWFEQLEASGIPERDTYQ